MLQKLMNKDDRSQEYFVDSWWYQPHQLSIDDWEKEHIRADLWMCPRYESLRSGFKNLSADCMKHN